MKKKLLIAALIIALAVPAAFAFKGGQRGGGIGMPTALLAKVLDMTDDQKTQFEAVMTEKREKRNEYRDEMRATQVKNRDEMRTKMDALHTETIEKLKEFLNDEQIEILTEMHEQRKSNREARGFGKGRGQGKSGFGGNCPQASVQ